MYNKYFTVEVKPDIDADLLGAAALVDDDVIFSWWPFEIPKGSSRLLNVTARVVSTCGTAQHQPFQLIFAKSRVNPATGSISNPISIGEYNTTANFVPSKNEAIGSIKIDTVDYLCQSLVGASLASTGNSVTNSGSSCDMVLTPAGSDHANYELSHTLPSGVALSPPSTVAITPGYDILWVAGIACGALDFQCAGLVTDGEPGIGDTVVHLDGVDANLVFSPGDVIQEADNTVIGTIVDLGPVVSSALDVDVTITPALTLAIADGVVIYPRNPITLELSFEK